MEGFYYPNEANKDLTSSSINISSFEKAAKKAKKAVESADSELVAIEEKLEHIQAELEKLQSEAQDVNEAYENVKSIEEDIRKSIRAIEKEYEEVKKTHSKLQCVEIETAGQIDNVLRQIKDLDKRTKHWKGELRRLKVAEENDKEYISDDEDEDDDNDDFDDEDNNEKEADDVDAKGNEEETDNVERKEKNRKIQKIESLPTFSNDALEQYDKEEVKYCIQNLELEYKKLAKDTNMAAIAEYRKKEADYLVR